jgi:hypothetical protein
MVTGDLMSEFKFACPVCGQHITADPSTSGGHIECPTCYQKIVVPQAPASADTKLILSASQVSKPRPTGTDIGARPESRPTSRPRPTLAIVALTLLLIGAAGAGAYVLRDRIMGAIRGKPSGNWSLTLNQASFPETNAAGRIHGRAFTCEQATLQNVTLALRQGRKWPPELGISIVLPRELAHEPGGKSLEIKPDQSPPVPRVILHWKDEQEHALKQDFTGGYALKLAFEEPSEGHVPGKIYLCLPDEAKSVVAGRFDAVIRKPRGGGSKGPAPRK